MPKCFHCNYSSVRKFNLDRHKLCKHPNETDNIPNVNIPIISIPIENNSEDIIKNKKFNCSKCNKSYNTTKFLNEHEDKCKGLSILACPKCMKVFKYQQGKSKHMKTNNCKAKIDIDIEKDNNKKFNCSKCYKFYNTTKFLNNHEATCKGLSILTCPKCLKVFKHHSSKSKHIKINNCKPVLPVVNKTINIQTDNINDKLINMILEKNKKLEILNKTIENNNYEIDNNTTIEIPLPLNKEFFIILNDVVITSQIDNNYINATLLCQAGAKKFEEWYSLKSTNDIIREFEKNNTASIINKDQYIWIHPDLASQLSNWISPMFYYQITKWIRSLLSKDELLEEKDKRLKLLENTYVKKHPRVNYKVNNVIYILTTKDYKKRRTYIIGKAINLTNRLSTYNKTIEHEVVYYKGCNNKQQLNVIENMILLKLNKYQEVANRDRFILPIENDISLFINIINDSINFF